jgi:hypothetical protein
MIYGFYYHLVLSERQKTDAVNRTATETEPDDDFSGSFRKGTTVPTH